MRRLLDSLFLRGTVCEVEDSGGRIRGLTLDGPGLAGLTVVPGQQVRVQVSADNWLVDRVVGTLRTYSIWRYDGERLQLRIVDHHGDGPGARWARTVRVGDEVHLRGPEGAFVCRPGDHHLFIGDETASVAFGAMIRGLGDDAQVHAVVEVESEQEELPLGRGVVWVHRHGRPAARSAELVKAVAALDLPATPGTAYLAGEAGTIQLVRDHLVRERGWSRRDVVTKPFWAPGKTGME